MTAASENASSALTMRCRRIASLEAQVAELNSLLGPGRFDFAVALDYMRKGRKVRCKSWGVELRLHQGAFYSGNERYRVGESEVLATDWELVP